MLRAEHAAALLLARGNGRRALRMPLDTGTLTPPAPHLGGAEPMWAEIHERLHAFVARRVPDRAAVDDLAQDILLRLYAHIGRLRDQERLDAWAYQVARNVIADYWRERTADRELPLAGPLEDRLAALPEIDPEDEADHLRMEIAACLEPMIERLAEPYRSAIRLTDLGAQTQSHAAAALGLSVPGMKARVQRGRAQLRELLRACCRIELDRRGQVLDYEPNGSGPCGCHRGS